MTQSVRQGGVNGGLSFLFAEADSNGAVPAIHPECLL
jgi:hypothetical protein